MSPTTEPHQGLAHLLLALLLGIAFLLTGTAWAFSSPPGSSPDDDHHLASIWCPHPIESSGCTLVSDTNGKVVGVKVPQEVALAPCYAFQGKKSAACELTLSETTPTNTDRVDRGGYPGGFFRAMHPFVTSSVDATVLTVRLVNVGVASLLVFGLVWAAPTRSRAMTATVLLVTFTPLGLFFIASTNPSSWAIVGVPAFYLAASALTLEDRPPFRWVHLVTATAGAALACAARADAAVYILLAALAVILRSLETGRGIDRFTKLLALRGWLIVFVIGVSCAAWALLAGRQASVAAATEGVASTGRHPIQLLYNNILNYPSLIGGFSGLSWGLGWLDTAMPPLASYPAFASACALLLVGLRRMRPAKAAAMAVVGLPLVFIPFYILQMQMQYVGEYVQPRYILPLWTVLIAIGVLGGQQERVQPGLTGPQWTVLLGSVTVAHAAALFTNMRRYLTGLDAALGFGSIEWWWSMPGSLEGHGWLGALAMSPKVWVLLGSLGFATACASTLLIAWLEAPRFAAEAKDSPLARSNRGGRFRPTERSC